MRKIFAISFYLSSIILVAIFSSVFSLNTTFAIEQSKNNTLETNQSEDNKSEETPSSVTEIKDDIDSDVFLIVAYVGDRIITNIDLENRIDIATDNEISDNSTDIKNVRKLVLQDLIDEELKLQVAEKSGIIIGEDQINNAIISMEKARGLEAGSLRKLFDKKSLSFNSMRRKIKSDLLFGSMVLREIKRKLAQSSNAEISQRILEQKFEAGAKESIYRLRSKGYIEIVQR